MSTSGNDVFVPRKANSALAAYFAKTRQFSRNANLYVLHVIGMDMIHGSFTVLFNLYLLALGFDIRFIGLRLMIGFCPIKSNAMPMSCLIPQAVICVRPFLPSIT